MKLRSIQILRGIAAMAVVAHHAFDLGTPVGAAGVDLFFVISGYIMATYAEGRRPAEFLADRAWRIYPLWLIAVTPWLLMTPQSALSLVRNLSLWPVYGNQFLNPALGVGWTLSFELLFYLGFAVSLANRAALPLAIFALSLLLGFETREILFWFVGSPLTLEFLLGVVIARLPLREPIGFVILGLGAAWFCIAPTTFYDQAFGPGALYRSLCWGIPAALLLYGARSLERHFSGSAYNAPVLLGSASYSIYLFHQLVMVEVRGFAGFALSALTGVAVYVMIEKRIMRARPHWRFARVPKLGPQAAPQG